MVGNWEKLHKQKINAEKWWGGIPAERLVQSAEQTGIVPKYVRGIVLHSARIYSMIVQVTQLKLLQYNRHVLLSIRFALSFPVPGYMTLSHLHFLNGGVRWFLGLHSPHPNMM